MTATQNPSIRDPAEYGDAVLELECEDCNGTGIDCPNDKEHRGGYCIAGTIYDAWKINRILEAQNRYCDD